MTPTDSTASQEENVVSDTFYSHSTTLSHYSAPPLPSYFPILKIPT